MPTRFSKPKTHVSEREAELMRTWHKQGKSKADIMRLLHRCKPTVTLHLARKPAKVGPKPKITKQVYKKLCTALQTLQRKAKAKKEVTVSMVIAKAGVDVSERCALESFHKNEIFFRPLQTSPILSKDDIVARKAWAQKFKGRRANTWLTTPDAIIDNKHFPLFRDRAGRAEAARRQVRGAFRRRGREPRTWLVRNKPSQKFPVKGVQVTAAVVGGKIRMWRYVRGNWCGQEAAAMYGDLLKVMRRANPAKAARKHHCWTVLEDNDPAGYKASKGKAAKNLCNIKAESLPPRSPQLNALDYCLWHEINRRMVSQEQKMAVNRKESVAAFKARLRKVALSLPRSIVRKAVMDMRRRTLLLDEAEGALFVEQ